MYVCDSEMHYIDPVTYSDGHATQGRYEIASCLSFVMMLVVGVSSN